MPGMPPGGRHGLSKVRQKAKALTMFPGLSSMPNAPITATAQQNRSLPADLGPSLSSPGRNVPRSGCRWRSRILPSLLQLWRSLVPAAKAASDCWIRVGTLFDNRAISHRDPIYVRAAVCCDDVL